MAIRFLASKVILEWIVIVSFFHVAVQNCLIKIPGRIPNISYSFRVFKLE